MAKIETLEHAKHRAAASFARMTSGGPESAQATTRDEQDVLRARVDVLNVLMRNPDARLCLESSGTGARACVTYDRMRCEGGELELGPMQSTMSWAVRGGEDPVLNLLSAGDNAAGHASVVRGLLGLIRESAPKKDVLRGLHELLALPAPERLVLKSVGGINSTRQDHTRVVEGLGEAGAGPVPPLYRITWGALDLDVLEGWQNPSTNTAIRLSILDTAHQSVREAERTKAPAWSNVSYLQARIFHNDECHVLNLRPFWDSESCTVSHLQYKQSVFDDSGPERGILNLTQDARAVHAIPMGKILPIQAYVCLGAHRKSRLNEAQLNYVHAQGLLAHGLDVKLLPDAGTLLENASAGKMIAAKSTRVSAEKLDIMASSYHVADQVYTTISVVQYPPFGTQFEKQVVATPPLAKAGKPVNMRIGGWGSDGEDDESQHVWNPDEIDFDDPEVIRRFARDNNVDYDPRRDPESDVYDPRLNPYSDQYDPDLVARTFYNDDDDREEEQQAKAAPKKKTNPDWVPKPKETVPHPIREGEKQIRAIREDQDEPLYKVGRDFKHDNIPRSLKMIRKSARPGNWNENLMEGEHYFIDGVLGNPYTLAKRFILFELDNGMRYKFIEQKMDEVKKFYKLNRSEVWKSEYPFYWNILKNSDKHHPDEVTIGNTWRGAWREFIRQNMLGMKEALQKTDRPAWFWYTEDEQQWRDILKDDPTFATQYIAFARKYHADLVHAGHISTQNLIQRVPQLASPYSQIPMPQTLFSARASTKSILRQEANPAVLHQLQHRIDALETRLSRVHQEENTKHLLEQVLDKLDSLETAV